MEDKKMKDILEFLCISLKFLPSFCLEHSKRTSTESNKWSQAEISKGHKHGDCIQLHEMRYCAGDNDTPTNMTKVKLN